eukprot:CAMPEP_0174938376 /NCGR_PEP_ID=MMETSP1355-20121228/63340_1 /TAXON_ID=464990 /ORGANISM="Hemiselmis tepida, Strain CCMP443" /LENGTH=71 /DNA_ID=CAMNT_0016185301 /DNA_START=20 /DNA_END=232 /DNA_ORIENTATION=+
MSGLRFRFTDRAVWTLSPSKGPVTGGTLVTFTGSDMVQLETLVVMIGSVEVFAQSVADGRAVVAVPRTRRE